MTPVADEPQEIPAAPASPAWEPAPRSFTPQPSEFHAPSSSGLEPLPGESLSKWKHREPAAEVHTLPVIPAVQHREEIEEQESAEAHERHAVESSHEEHAAELSEEEATALAEQVAEAQVEEATRNAQQRDFAAQEEAHEANLSGAEEHASESTEEEDVERHETDSDAEEEAEEAQAEAEGMIAHPDDMEHADGNQAEAMHAEGGSDHSDEEQSTGNQSTENQPPPEQQPWKAQVRNDFRAHMQHPARRGGRDRGPRRDDRGRRPQHGHSGGSHGHSRPQPRRTQLIADMLKQGQEIIVQIAKEPLGKKGARITSHVALPGRYLVYMPTLDHTGVSRKIASAEDRARLRHLVNEAKGAGGGGFIVRTAAGSATSDEIRTDVEFLMRTWAEIKARSEQRKAPSLLHRDLNLVERILRDYMSPDYSAVWVDTEEEFTKVVDFMSRFQPQLVNRVKLYTKDTPVFEEFGIQQEIDKGLRPKVWLKSGGYIVINHTVAAELAASRQKKLTVVVKDAGLPAVSALWRDVAGQAAAGAGVALRVVDIDLVAYLLLQDPLSFDVIAAASNLFGDVLADLGAVLLGSRGVSFSGNYSEGGAAVPDRTRGSAIDLAGLGRANPVGQILSLAMMLRESFGLVRESQWIEEGVAEVLRHGYRTFDVAAPGTTLMAPPSSVSGSRAVERRARHGPMRPALLLVDLQLDFLNAPGLEPASAIVVARAARLLEGARAAGVPILHAVTTVEPDGGNRMPHWKARETWRCVRGTPGHAPPPGLAPRDGEAVVEGLLLGLRDSRTGLERALADVGADSGRPRRSPSAWLRACDGARCVCPRLRRPDRRGCRRERRSAARRGRAPLSRRPRREGSRPSRSSWKEWCPGAAPRNGPSDALAPPRAQRAPPRRRKRRRPVASGVGARRSRPGSRRSRTG